MANISVKRQIWESLSPKQQASASEALTNAGILQAGDSIVPRDEASAGADAASGTGNEQCIDTCFYVYSMASEQCGDGAPDQYQACMDEANNILSACLKNCPDNA
jgi:hypothetical protein